VTVGNAVVTPPAKSFSKSTSALFLQWSFAPPPYHWAGAPNRGMRPHGHCHSAPQIPRRRLQQKGLCRLLLWAFVKHFPRGVFDGRTLMTDARQ